MTNDIDQIKPNPSRAASLRVACLLLSVAARLAAQTATGGGAAPPAAGDQVVTMNPFDVGGDQSDSYNALNSNSLTRFNMELWQTPVSADIFTSAFIQDTGTQAVEDVIRDYSAAAGVSSVDATNVGSQPFDHVAHNYTEIRGFYTAAMQRDSLMPVGPLFSPGNTSPGTSNTFDVERIEVIEGPQALLYSAGGPGGVVNIVSKLAQLNEPATGSVQYRVDQYGTKDALLDFGVGNSRFAVRLALVDDDTDTRRVNVGGTLQGAYMQVEAKPVANTTVRINLEQTHETAMLGDPGILLSSVTGDSRGSDALSYLLFANQLGATVNPSTGVANAAGPILNGTLNWNNIDSLAGQLQSEWTTSTWETMNVQTVWNEHLSTELALGYANANWADTTGVKTLYAPTNSTNPTGAWAMGETPSEDDTPTHTKSVRFTLLDSAELFDGRASTQTILGGDFTGSRAYSINYAYYQADSNWNPVYVAPIVNSEDVTTNSNGRTSMPTLYFPIAAAGSIPYPLLTLGATRITWNGVNYVRMVSNMVNPTLINPSNPLGLSSTSGLNEYTIVNNKGYFLANMTQWLDKRLTTLVGVRFANAFDARYYPPPQPLIAAEDWNVDYELGADYELLPWMSAYVSASSVGTLPSIDNTGPSGNGPYPGKGEGEEAGLKFQNQSRSVSGTLSLYHAYGTNQEFSSATLENVIAPSGLNGRGNAGSYFFLDHITNGVELNATANPVKNWRIRFDMSYQVGRLTNSGSYPLQYNDQFYENSVGDVTYADGTVVYVSSSNAKAAPSPTALAGYVPLTVAMMNSPSSLYYANPTDPTGAISSSSAVATVLKTTDPTHGPILTGAINLPISDLQITPPFTVPSTIQAFEKGDAALGEPQFHYELTNMYTFDQGFLKGFGIGATINAQWRDVGFYYLVNGFSTANPPRSPFFLPVVFTVDPVLQYSKRLKYVTLHTQLNIYNVFNHYSAQLIPSQSTGYTTPANLTAALFGAPRMWAWTNSLSF